MLGLLGPRIFEATGSNIEDLGEEHGHRVLRVRGKGDKVVLVPLPPAVGRALERAVEDRTRGPILLTSRGTRMDRHCATRRLRRLAEEAGVKLPRMHPHRPLGGADVGCTEDPVDYRRRSSKAGAMTGAGSRWRRDLRSPAALVQLGCLGVILIITGILGLTGSYGAGMAARGLSAFLGIVGVLCVALAVVRLRR
jgi:hypothetical protein